jgi:hypothetical protein
MFVCPNSFMEMVVYGRPALGRRAARQRPAAEYNTITMELFNRASRDKGETPINNFGYRYL